MDRRSFLKTSATGLALAATAPAARATISFAEQRVVPLRVAPDRIFRITVCLRPFRAAGPRIEPERMGRKLVIHNYGHGGSGWSLAWGSAQEAVAIARQAGAEEVAVIGAGAIGMTTALAAQRAGLKTVIHAREHLHDTRSARATGTWSPDSRVALANAVSADFAERWEKMARASFAGWQTYLGAPGNPVEWTDRYSLYDRPAAEERAAQTLTRVQGFVELGSRLRDISPRSIDLPAGSHPFNTPFARLNSSLSFNVAELSRQLHQEFLMAGGRLVQAEFHEPNDLARLKQKVIINCTGYGARALWRDDSIIPVRGQIAWLIPQDEARYGLYYKGISVLARRDGIVVQPYGADDSFGYGDASEDVDRAAAEAAVTTIAGLFAPKPALPAAA